MEQGKLFKVEGQGNKLFTVTGTSISEVDAEEYAKILNNPEKYPTEFANSTTDGKVPILSTQERDDLFKSIVSAGSDRYGGQFVDMSSGTTVKAGRENIRNFLG